MKHHQTLGRGLGLLIALLMCLSLLPATATAATSYGFSILGTAVTSDNVDDLSKLSGVSPTDSSKPYSISYDAASDTLTLNNVTIDGEVPTSYTCALLDCGSSGVKHIKLVGQNVITGTASATSGYWGIYGIHSDGSLTIEGDSRADSLTITVPQYNYGLYKYVYLRGIDVIGPQTTLTIQNCTLDVFSEGGTYTGQDQATNAIFAGSNGDGCNCNITIKNAKINAVIGKRRADGTAVAAIGGTAIYAKGGTLSITDSDVTAHAFSSRTNPGWFTSLEGSAIVLSGCTLDLKVDTAVYNSSTIRRVLYTNGAKGVTISNCTGTMTSPMLGIQMSNSTALSITGSLLTIDSGIKAVSGLAQAPTFVGNIAVRSGADAASATDVADLSSTTEKYWENPYLAVRKSIGSYTVETIPDQTYTGTALTPAVTVKKGDVTLTKGTDYTVSYENNVNAGTATVVITGAGEYGGTLRQDFTINKATPGTPTGLTGTRGKTLSTVTLPEGWTWDAPNTTMTTVGNYSFPASYSGNANYLPATDNLTVQVQEKPTNTTDMTVTQASFTYSESTAAPVVGKPTGAGAVTFSYAGRSGTTYGPSDTAPANAGDYTVTARCEDSDYIYTATADFTINKKSITGMTVTLSGTSKVYSGSNQTVTVTSVGTLTAPDYDVITGTTGKNAGTYTVTVTGKGNYTGTASAQWEITPKSITVTPKGGQSKTYGESDPTLTYALSEALCSGDSMSGALSRASGENAGTYAINLGTLSAGSNYTLSLNTTPVDFTINQKPITINTATATSRNYAAGDVSVETVVTFNDAIGTLTKGTDYTVTGQMDDANAGTGKTVNVTVTLIGSAATNYTLTPNTTTTTVTIDPKPIAEADFTTLGTESKTYTGSEQTQTITSGTLTLDTDYTVTYSDNVYAGTDTAKYTIAGIGNYTGSFGKTFSITAADYDCTNVPTSLEGGRTYTAETIKSAIPNAGDVTIVSVKVMKTDGTEVTGANANAIATFDSATQTIKAIGAGKVEITYSIAANNVDGSGAAEYSAADGKTVEITASAAPSSGGSNSTSYSVTADETVNGTVTVSLKSASRGTTVTITVTPDKGYTLEALTVTDKNGSEIELTDKGDGKYTFTMPASKVTVKATFMEDNSMLNFFVDVPADAYYYDAVLWAAENGITDGVDETHFAPDATCTRAQIVTFLWRAAGCPEPESLSSFADVPADSYYAKAVAWAVEQGITVGTGDGKFSPDAPCTRAQCVAFLWRAQGTPDAAEGNPFIDVAEGTFYTDAVLWAAENGITLGTDAESTTFSPDGDCTRAQIVTFLYRCLGE